MPNDFLTVDEIILLHEKQIRATGGTPGLRDRALLESAVLSVNTGFDDVEQYPTTEEKAARLTFALIRNHAFVDGNKRIGILAMLMTLSLNGISVLHTQPDLIELGLASAAGEIKYREILEWIASRKARIS